MKQFLLLAGMVISISFAKLGFAEGAKLQMNITGDVKHAYLCINNVGCYKMGTDTKGKVMPIDIDNIQYVAMANIHTQRLYKQALPASCNVMLAENKTLVISGHVSAADNNQHVINSLRCSVL
jgi:hypothetical protein